MSGGLASWMGEGSSECADMAPGEAYRSVFGKACWCGSGVATTLMSVSDDRVGPGSIRSYESLCHK